MPEKYQSPQEEQDELEKHFILIDQEPAENPSLPKQEIGEFSFDQDKYEKLIENIKELQETILMIGQETPPEYLIKYLHVSIDGILGDIDIAEQALMRDDSKESAMILLRQLVEIGEEQENQEMSQILKKTFTRARDMLERNLDVIDASIRDDPYQYGATVLRTLLTVCNYGWKYRAEAIRMLEQHKDIADSLMNANFLQHADLLELIFSYGSKEDQGRWHKKINAFFDGEASLKFLGCHAVENLFKSKDAVVKNHGKALVRHELHKYGMSGKDAVDTLQAWLVSDEYKYVPHAIAKNLGVISELEKNQSGSVERLSREFDIKNFARYPMQLLLTQDANRENTDDPYGIIMYARRDHNGIMYKISGALQELYQSLHGGYQLRVMEYTGKQNFGRKLLELRKRYGSMHKISFAVITEHGSQYKIGDLLATNELEKQRVRRVTDFFEKDSTVILLSCNTGKAYGIGQHLSYTLSDMHVIAPDESTSVNSIRTEIKEGKINFSVEYDKAQAQEYVGGKRQSSEKRMEDNQGTL